MAIWAHRSAPSRGGPRRAQAGAAFIMLDPAYPPARLVEILRARRAARLVRLDAAGRAAGRGGACSPEAAAAARLDLLPAAAAAAAGLARRSREPPPVAVGPDDVAL